MHSLVLVCAATRSHSWSHLISLPAAFPCFLLPCVVAFAGHTVLAGAFPWFQGKYDMMIGKQLSAVSAADKKRAAEIAVPIAAKMLKER